MTCDGNVGIPFPTKQGNRPSRVEEGENGALLELCRETRCSSPVGTGISGIFLSCIKGVQYPFVFQEATWIPFETLLWERASSHIEGRISWFFFSCSGKLGAPLELRLGPQAALVASEKSGLYSSCEGHVGIPFESLPAHRALSRVQSVDSGFLTSVDRDLGLPIKLQPESQASSGDEARNSAFLLSCQRGVWTPVEFRWQIWASSRGSA